MLNLNLRTLTPHRLEILLCTHVEVFSVLSQVDQDTAISDKGKSNIAGFDQKLNYPTKLVIRNK